ncbi:hypothetical protein OROHE_012317 [Orobanche hederae]
MGEKKENFSISSDSSPNRWVKPTSQSQRLRISDLRGPAQEFPLLRSITGLAILYGVEKLQRFLHMFGDLDFCRSEQSRKEREELDKMLEENRRRVEEAQRREALELQRKEEERLQELELIQRQKEEAARRRRVEEEEERANQMLSGEDWDGMCGYVFGALACEVEALGLFCSAQ